MIETFVMNGIGMQRGWASTRTSLYHYRTHTGQEVDLVLEDRKGRIVGIEVKRKSTLKAADFRGLESLREAVGKRFHRGVVLYGGDEVRRGGERVVGVLMGWS